MSFRLYALNYNGKSEPSDIYTFNVCTVPKGMQSPFKIFSISNSITLGWKEPQSNGGCAVIGYAIFRDDSVGGDVIVEVNEDNDTEIRDNSILRQATISNFPVDTVGNFFRFKMRVYNREGSSESALVTFLNAGPPDKPSSKVLLLE